MTMASLIPVRRSISKGIGTSGFTNSSILSMISPFLTFTAPISMILFFVGENPVVSISNTTYSPSRLWFLELTTISFISSTRYPSTP